MRGSGGLLVCLLVAMAALAVPPPAGGGDAPPPERSMDGTPTFTNATGPAGLSGGGNFFAWGDYDRDGDEDLLVDGGRLWSNDGDGTFTDATAASGITGGGNGNWADFNGDGYLDFYQVGPNRLWRNDGDGTFTDVTVAAGNPTTSDPTGVVAWADYDRDGDLDFFIAGSEFWTTPSPIYYPDHLYRNNGDGTFTEVTTAALGTVEQTSKKYGRGATWADYDDDGWLDLYVTNYRQQRNYLYRNNRDGTFTDVAAATGPFPGFGDAPPDATNNPDPCNRAGHGVGSSWADYDNDGDLDLLVGTFNHKDWRTSDDTQLWRNDGSAFTNVRATVGIPVKPYDLKSPPNPQCGSSDGSIWTGPQGDELIVGATWGDVDNDGYLDLWMPQIYNINYAYSYLYRGNNGTSFTDIAQVAGVRVIDTYGGAFADYDQDGDLDLVTGGRDSTSDPGSIHLFRNDGNLGHAWVEVALEGCGPGTNPPMIGARLTFTAGGKTYLRNVEAGQNSHSQQNSMVQHVGLGHYAGSTVDVDIRRIDGTTVSVPGLAVNRIHRLRVGCVEPVTSPAASLSGTSLKDVTLTWTLPADETFVTGYAIYQYFVYERNGTGYQLLATVPKGTSTYVHANAGKGDWFSHFYRIVTTGVGTAAPCGRQIAKYALTLQKGPNLVSLPIVPFNATPSAVFASFVGEYRIVRAYDASDPGDPWKSKRADRGDYDLAAIEPGMGLWIHVLGTTSTSFAVVGYVPEETTVALKAGWNLVGYASFTARTMGVALAGIPFTSIEGFAPGISPYYLRHLDPASDMVHGAGYWICVTADASWTVRN